MAKPARSPVLGYNHNVRYQGHVFHVQTEDSGPGNPRVFTHLFFEGSILASKRCDYDAETPEDDVRGLMQGQHKAILKDLKQGLFDERVGRFFEMRGQALKPGAVALDTPSLGVPTDASIAPPADDATALPADAAAAPEPTAWVSPPDASDVASAGEPYLAAEVAMPPPPEAESFALAAGDLAPVEPSLPMAPAQLAFSEPEALEARAEPEVPTSAAVLDLDAVATPPIERAPTPEPLPIHATQPAMPGPGTYTLRRPVREPAPEPLPKPRTVAPAGRQVAPVVVQRQVIVATGGEPITAPRKPSTTPVRRRPVSSGPYVVKEGSHADIVVATSNRKSAPQPTAPEEEAPRTAEPPRPPQEAAPGVLVTDQSLDDVILAYLSQGERKG